MSDDFQKVKSKINIKVIGVGGGGCNAVDCMSEETIEGVTFYGLNTDLQALEEKDIENKIQIGETISRGLGAGADPEIGKQSAEESREEIMDILKDADMAFITAGMGGGTGTGAAPVVASISKELGILTVGIVTKPFDFENRENFAKKGIEELEKYCDCLLVIPNENLFKIDSEITILNCFKRADDILFKSVKGIAEIITKSSLINVDFADVKKVMSYKGNAMLGLGTSNLSEGSIEDAVLNAIETPLLETKSINGAKGVLINVSAGVDFSIKDLHKIGDIIKQKTREDSIIITGLSVDNPNEDEISITVVATDIDNSSYEEDILPPIRNNHETLQKHETLNSNKLDTKQVENVKEDILEPKEFNIPSFLRKHSK